MAHRGVGPITALAFVLDSSHGISPIAPSSCRFACHNENAPEPQESRVERLFAWLHHFRRLVIRWEYHVENFFGMVRLGCMQILFRYL